MPAEILADTLKFKQIVGNLVNNAVRFTEPGCVQVSMKIKAGKLEVAISATGFGIANEYLNTVYVSSHRDNSVLHREKLLSGMGLTVAKEFTQLLKRHLHVRSRVGEGSQFTVCLPCA